MAIISILCDILQIMYVAIDVGGTKIRISSFSKLDPKSLFEEKTIEADNNFTKSMEAISQVLGIVKRPIKAISVALPGYIVSEKTGIVLAANLPGWNKKDMREPLAKFVGDDKIFFLHDAKAHALAELVFAKTQDEFLYIAWGTGVGATYIKKYKSIVHSQQIEFGYQYVNGKYIEKLVGGSSFKKRFGKEALEMTEAEWKKVEEDFSVGLANLFALNYAPQIIWGGGVAIKQKKRLKKVVNLASEKFPFWKKPSFRLSSFGERGAVVGALGYIKLNL